MFGFQPNTCCALSSLHRAYVSNFVALILMVAKRMGIHSYVRKHQLPFFSILAKILKYFLEPLDSLNVKLQGSATFRSRDIND